MRPMTLDDYFRAFEDLATPLFALSRSGKVLRCNDSAILLLGQRPQGEVALFAPELHTLWEGFWTSAHSHTFYTQLVSRQHHAFVDVPVKATLSIVPCDSEMEPWMLLECVALDDILERAKEQVEFDMLEAHRMLLKNLAHEVKNPLGGLRGAAQLLAFELGDDFKEYTDLIHHETKRLEHLIDRFVEPFRQHVVNESVDIHSVLMHVERVLGLAFPRVRFRHDFDVSLPMMQADHTRLTQIFMNLVKNALEALTESGVVDPVVTLRTRLKRDVFLPGGRTKRALQVCVEDNGPGIPCELLGQIFYPLVTGRAEGTGLGLSLVKRYTQEAGAQVNVSSNPGLTTFEVVWPLG